MQEERLKGSIVQGLKPNKRGRNVSIIGAILVNEVLTSVNLIGTTDTITFEAFIIRKLVPKLWKGACVVMDNCTIHTSEEIEKAIKKKGAKLIYLSPYSPNFSPIEHLWSKLKNILRSIKTTNYQELAKAREFAFNEVTERKYWELAPVTAVIVPHLFEKGYTCRPIRQISPQLKIKFMVKT